LACCCFFFLLLGFFHAFCWLSVFFGFLFSKCMSFFDMLVTDFCFLLRLFGFQWFLWDLLLGRLLVDDAPWFLFFSLLEEVCWCGWALSLCFS